eukprot:TRINITY_DN2225_c0_g1_i2.p1 TRINITY_DN2225_c0_g1~~TRINITY_DN2225_c0_g1_i2.p1  ORF type:complete len:463 (+),score=112.89 TRINITY_DN2225_c0_g1_i2:115-1503(+)
MSFTDGIHGVMDFGQSTKLYREVIDTEAFQRLRDVKQTGALSHVYQGATHSRFEHSIGVGYLAHSCLDRLKSMHKDYDITQREVDLVGLAGLCHDLGHGPYSHAFERLVVPRILPEQDHQYNTAVWHHEMMSEMMLEYAINENDVVDLSSNEVRFVKDCISGDRTSAGERKFLFDIVANSRNSIDVDKVDYLARDTFQTGAVGSVRNYTYLFQNCRIIEDEICFRKNDMFGLFQLLNSRLEMHKSVYSNPVVQACEVMICEALVHAEPTLRIAESLFDPERFMSVSDSVVKLIEMNKDLDGDLQYSKSLLKRVRTRKLFKLVAEKSVRSKPIFTELTLKGDCERLKAEIINCQSGSRILSISDIFCYLFCFDFGMKEHNPLKFVSFYEESKPDRKANYAPMEFAMIISECCIEYTLRIFCTDPTEVKVRALQMAFEVYVSRTLPDEILPPEDLARQSKRPRK